CGLAQRADRVGVLWAAAGGGGFGVGVTGDGGAAREAPIDERDRRVGDPFELFDKLDRVGVKPLESPCTLRRLGNTGCLPHFELPVVGARLRACPGAAREGGPPRRARPPSRSGPYRQKA